MTDARCSHCKSEVDVCEFCERPDCPKAICYRCMREALLPRAPDLEPAEPRPSN